MRKWGKQTFHSGGKITKIKGRPEMIHQNDEYQSFSPKTKIQNIQLCLFGWCIASKKQEQQFFGLEVLWPMWH